MKLQPDMSLKTKVTRVGSGSPKYELSPTRVSSAQGTVLLSLSHLCKNMQRKLCARLGWDWGHSEDCPGVHLGGQCTLI
jgi:hypothetical protein